MINRILYWSICVFAVLPLGSIFDIAVSQFSLFKIWLLGFFLFLVPVKRLKAGHLILILLLISVYLASLALAPPSFYLLARDAFTVVFFWVCLFAFWVGKREILSEELVKRLLVFGVFIDAICYVVMRLFDIAPPGIRGVFYETTGIIRYSDLFSYTIFFLSAYFYGRESKVVWLICMLVVSVLALDRVFLLFTALYVLRHATKRWSMLPIILVPAAVVTFVNFDLSVIYDGLRVADLSSAAILSDVWGRSFQPALYGGYQFSLSTLFLGEGPGFGFYVPWFEYRNIDPYSLSIDNFFVFSVVKYGVLYLLVALAIILLILSGSGIVIMNLTYLFFHNGTYNDGYLMFLIVFLLLKK